jgi:hypothetical protein
MAEKPSALGLVEAFELASKAVAVAGRTIALESANPFGGLAVKTARLDFQFEMSVTSDLKGVTVGMGLRNSLFGPTVATGTDRQESSNRGSITLEIVAVAPEPPAPLPPPGVPPKALAAFGRKLEALSAALLAADWPADRVGRVQALIDVAEQAAQGGDLTGAEAVLALLAEALAPVPPKAPASPPKARGPRKPGG